MFISNYSFSLELATGKEKKFTDEPHNNKDEPFQS